MTGNAAGAGRCRAADGFFSPCSRKPSPPNADHDRRCPCAVAAAAACRGRSRRGGWRGCARLRSRWAAAPWPGRRRRSSRRRSSSPRFDVSRDEDGVYLNYAVEFELPARGRGRAGARRCRCSSSPRPTSSATAGTGATAASRTRAASGGWSTSRSPSTYRVTPVGGLEPELRAAAEAIAAISRAPALEVAEAAQARGRRPPLPRVQYRLDTSQLPRPMQIGITGVGGSPTGSSRSSARSASSETTPVPATAATAREPSRADRPGQRAGPGSSRPAGRRSAPGWCSPFLLGRDQQPGASTSATTSGCSGSTSRWRALLVLVIVVAGVRLLLAVSRGRASSAAGCCSSWRRSSRSSASCPGVLIYTVATSSSRARSRAGSTSRSRARSTPASTSAAARSTRWSTDLGTKTRLAAERLGEARAAGRAARARAPARAALGAGGRARRRRRADAAHRQRQRARSRPDARAARAAAAAPGAHAARRQPGRGPRRGRRRPTACSARACARSRCIPSSDLGARRAGALPAWCASRSAAAGGQRAGGAERLPRVPAARARARRPAPHVHRHADAGAGAGGVRRGAAGGRARQPARAAAAAAGRGRAQVARGDLSAKAGVHVARRARRPDALVRRDDRAARPTRASWCSTSVVAGRRRARQPADHPRQPDRRRDRVRPPAAASTPSTRARRASCGCRCRPIAGRRLDEVPGLADVRAGGLAALRAARGQPRGRRARPLAGLVRAADRSTATAASATRSPCWCAARRCRRARA